MKEILPFLIMLLLVSVAGCSKVGTTLDGMQGQYYLDRADHAGGRAAFASRLAEKPDDPVLNYYMARFELGADNPDAALPRIQKAVALSPGTVEYHFWEGVTWWALMQPDKESAAYKRALVLDPNHLSANLYLGHNMLDRGNNDAALAHYNKVLSLNPHESQAMFNKSVALERLKRTAEMKKSLLGYLERYPDTSLACQGVRMLNKSGDFSWRNHVIGLRTVPLQAVAFRTGTAILTDGAASSLQRIGAIMSAKPSLELHVVVYVGGNAKLARERALAVRTHVHRVFPDVASKRLVPSWFGQSEMIKTDGGAYARNESVNIFTKIQ
jgi:tetratricopeptide (TPR) repeat protein